MLINCKYCNSKFAINAEEVGFEAVYMTGCGTAAERGFSDVGLLTMTEMVANAKYIAQAVDIPVIANGDITNSHFIHPTFPIFCG